MPTNTYTATHTVYLVGAGPGDPDLITVKGRDILRKAGAVVYDALANPALLAEVPPAAELIFAGKRAGRHALSQDEINELLFQLAQKHAVVVRLKGGDPFVFGRGGEELAYLRARGVRVEVVPGISSAVAAAAAAGVPVTHRGLSNNFAVVTGHQVDGALHEPNWRALTAADTLVIMMGLGAIDRVVERLIAAGRDQATPAMVISAATLPDQAVVVAPLAELPARVAAAGLRSPATIVVGEVVNMAETAPAARPAATPWSVVAEPVAVVPLTAIVF